MKKKFAKPMLFLTAFIWGSTFTVAKIVTETFSATFVNAMRFTIASACLLIAAYPLRRLADKKYIFYGTLMGITLFGSYLMQTVGLTWDTSPGKSAFLSTTYCIFVPFLYWGVTKKKPKLQHLACVLICVTGVGILSLKGGGGMTNGDIITVLSGIPGAANIVVSSIGCKGRNTLLLTAIELGVVMILSWAGVLLTGSMPASYSAEAVGGLIYLGIFATALCLASQSFGLKYTEAAIGGMILSLEAVFGVLCSVVLYHEQVTGRMIVGFAVIFAAIILSQIEFGKKEKDSTDPELLEAD